MRCISVCQSFLCPGNLPKKEELTWYLSALLYCLSQCLIMPEMRKVYLKQLIPEDYKAYVFFLIPSRTISRSVSFQNYFTIVTREKDQPWQARNLLVPGSESHPTTFPIPLIQTCGLCSYSLSHFWDSLACYLKLLAFASPGFNKLSTSTNCT